MSTTPRPRSVIGSLLALLARRDQVAVDVEAGLCPSRHPHLGWACERRIDGHDGLAHVGSRLALRSKLPAGCTLEGDHHVARWG